MTTRKNYYTPSISLHPLIYKALKLKKAQECISISAYINKALANAMNINIAGGSESEKE